VIPINSPALISRFVALRELVPEPASPALRESATVVRELLVKHYDPGYAASIRRNFKRFGEASPIVLADAVAAAPAASAGSAFAFGPTALWPATTDRFAQARELSVAFRVFNWSAPAEGKPGKVRRARVYTLKPGMAHIYNEGDVHSPKRVAATGLLRIEGKNTQKMKRFAYKAI